jgi:Protein of unknown function (DUF2852)
MNCCGMSFGFRRAVVARDASAGRHDSATGNGATAERPIAAVWPERGQRAFGAFLARLGEGNDSAEFDRFINDRRGVG